MNSFRRGFRTAHPLVLIVAAALLVPAMLGFEYFFTSGAWSAIPLKYCLRNKTDSFAYVSWMVGRNKQQPPKLPAIYITGGSASREGVVSGSSLAAQVRRLGGPRVVAWDFGSINQNFAETMAVADNVPASRAWLLIGVNLGRFTIEPPVDEQQVVGRDFLLKSASLQEWVADTTGHYKYSFTILPGIFSYLTSYLKKDGRDVLRGDIPARPYVQHHYSVKRVYGVPKKESLVAKWNRQIYPVFRRNVRFNLALLEQILVRCRKRGVHAVILQLPENAAIIDGRFDEATAMYKKPTQALAAKYHVPYLDFNQKVALPNGDFYDLSHLVEPGRVIWQRQLAKELVALLGPDGNGGEAAQ